MKNLAENETAAITGGVGGEGALPSNYIPLISDAYIASILALLEPRRQVVHTSD